MLFHSQFLPVYILEAGDVIVVVLIVVGDQAGSRAVLQRIHLLPRLLLVINSYLLIRILVKLLRLRLRRDLEIRGPLHLMAIQLREELPLNLLLIDVILFIVFDVITLLGVRRLIHERLLQFLLPVVELLESMTLDRLVLDQQIQLVVLFRI